MSVNRRSLAALLFGALLVVAIGTNAFAQSTWDQIQERNSIRLGVASSDPWYFQDPLTNQWDGLGVRLGQALAEDLGVALELVETSYGNAPAALQSGRIDVMFVLDATEERKQTVDFIEGPLFRYSLAVLHHDSLVVETWDDVDNPDLNVGVTLGTSIDTRLTELLNEANLSRYPSNDETVASFQSGRSDVVSMFAPALTALQLRVGIGTITEPEPKIVAETSAGYPREADSEWGTYLTETLGQFYENGTTARLYREYLESRGIDPDSVPGLQ